MDIRKTGIIAGLICVVSAASAQVTTTSSVVGFRKIDEPAGFHISGMQFNVTTNNSPETIYGDTLPSGSKIYKWTGSGYSSATYGPVFVPGQGLVTKWNASLTLDQGEGYWVESPSAVDASFYGEVPLADTVTNSISAGFQLCSFPYPIDRVITNLGFTPISGDKIYVWNGSSYASSSYGQVFVPGQGLVTKWNNETLSISVGEGFWYESGVNTNWVATRPFSLD